MAKNRGERMPPLCEVNLTDLFLVVWDGTFPAHSGPVPFEYFFSDADGHLIHRDFLTRTRMLTDGRVRVSWQTTVDEDRSRSVAQKTGTWLDTNKHRIQPLLDGCLIQIPVVKDLPSAVLEIMMIPFQDLATVQPEGIRRMVYVERKTGDLMMHRLAIYFYLLGCYQLVHGERAAGKDNLVRAIWSGPVFPHPYLLAAANCSEKKDGFTAKLFLGFAAGVLKKLEKEAVHVSPKPNLETQEKLHRLERAAKMLFQMELNERRGETEDVLGIARYVAAHTPPSLCGENQRRLCDYGRTLRQLLDQVG